MDEKNYRKGEKYLKQNRPDETGFEKMSDEETPEEVHDAVEKLSAIVDVPEPEAKVPEPVVKSVPEQEERPIELVSPAPCRP